MPKDYGPEIEFAIFTNDFRQNERHPNKKGTIEFNRAFLKSLVDVAKTGTMPVVSVAVWDRVSKNTNVSYQSVKLQLKQPVANEEPAPVEEENDDGLPF